MHGSKKKKLIRRCNLEINKKILDSNLWMTLGPSTEAHFGNQSHLVFFCGFVIFGQPYSQASVTSVVELEGAE
jgi:hypothetical protein